MKPKISVVMPTYNRAGLVRHAIQSIVDQTFNDWELVIIDDGSTDETENVVKLYLKDKRIRYFKNKTNKGISYSRNRGNKLAKADIIVVQDSDDMSLPDRLERINEWFEQNPKTDFLYHWFYVRAMDGRFGARAIHRELHSSGPYDPKRALEVPYIPGQAAYKRSVVLKTPYREEIKTWDDWMLIMELTLKKRTFHVIERPLYEYVLSDDSVTTMGDGDGTREKDKAAVKKILSQEYKVKVTDA